MIYVMFIFMMKSYMDHAYHTILIHYFFFIAIKISNSSTTTFDTFLLKDVLSTDYTWTLKSNLFALLQVVYLFTSFHNNNITKKITCLKSSF